MAKLYSSDGLSIGFGVGTSAPTPYGYGTTTSTQHTHQSRQLRNRNRDILGKATSLLQEKEKELDLEDSAGSLNTFLGAQEDTPSPQKRGVSKWLTREEKNEDPPVYEKSMESGVSEEEEDAPPSSLHKLLEVNDLPSASSQEDEEEQGRRKWIKEDGEEIEESKEEEIEESEEEESLVRSSLEQLRTTDELVEDVESSEEHSHTSKESHSEEPESPSRMLYSVEDLIVDEAVSVDEPVKETLLQVADHGVLSASGRMFPADIVDQMGHVSPLEISDISTRKEEEEVRVKETVERKEIPQANQVVQEMIQQLGMEGLDTMDPENVAARIAHAATAAAGAAIAAAQAIGYLQKQQGGSEPVHGLWWDPPKEEEEEKPPTSNVWEAAPPQRTISAAQAVGVGTDRLQALIASEPTSATSLQLMRQQLELLRGFVRANQRIVQAEKVQEQRSSQRPYTTLDETRSYILRNMPRVRTMEEALAEVRAEEAL